MTGTRDLRRAALWTLPAVALVGVLLAVALASWVAAPRWDAVAMGAGGWLLALVLRGPIAAAVAKLPPGRAATIVGAASGPCEEVVRLLLVVTLVSGFPEVVWAGYGWAAIEIGYTMVNAVLIRSLLGKTDERSLAALAMLESAGVLRTDGPAWAAVERTGASLLHIGFTLLLAWNPWLVLVAAPVHTAVNLLAVRLAPVSLALTEALVTAAGIGAFVIGLAQW